MARYVYNIHTELYACIHFAYVHFFGTYQGQNRNPPQTIDVACNICNICRYLTKNKCIKYFVCQNLAAMKRWRLSSTNGEHEARNLGTFYNQRLSRINLINFWFGVVVMGLLLSHDEPGQPPVTC